MYGLERVNELNLIPTTSFFNEAPEELLCEIFSKLAPIELIRIQRVCKRFQHVITKFFPPSHVFSTTHALFIRFFSQVDKLEFKKIYLQKLLLEEAVAYNKIGWYRSALNRASELRLLEAASQALISNDAESRDSSLNANQQKLSKIIEQKVYYQWYYSKSFSRFELICQMKELDVVIRAVVLFCLSLKEIPVSLLAEIKKIIEISHFPEELTLLLEVVLYIKCLSNLQLAEAKSYRESIYPKIDSLKKENLEILFEGIGRYMGSFFMQEPPQDPPLMVQHCLEFIPKLNKESVEQLYAALGLLHGRLQNWEGFLFFTKLLNNLQKDTLLHIAKHWVSKRECEVLDRFLKVIDPSNYQNVLEHVIFKFLDINNLNDFELNWLKEKTEQLEKKDYIREKWSLYYLSLDQVGEAEEIYNQIENKQNCLEGSLALAKYYLKNEQLNQVTIIIQSLSKINSFRVILSLIPFINTKEIYDSLADIVSQRILPLYRLAFIKETAKAKPSVLPALDTLDPSKNFLEWLAIGAGTVIHLINKGDFQEADKSLLKFEQKLNRSLKKYKEQSLQDQYLSFFVWTLYESGLFWKALQYSQLIKDKTDFNSLLRQDLVPPSPFVLLSNVFTETEAAKRMKDFMIHYDQEISRFLRDSRKRVQEASKKEPPKKKQSGHKR